MDPVAATEAYLASVPPEIRARSDAYFEGGYWLLLWAFLLTVAISTLLLQSGWSDRMRAFAERLTRVRSLQVAIYWVQYLLLTTALAFPLTVYRGFFREHQYGMATQDFASWMTDQLKALGLGVVLGVVAVVGLYRVFRAFPRTWWAWGAAFVIVLNMISLLIFPVFIAPVFNTYTPLEDPVIRDPILRLAQANGISTERVFVVDASRQTKRISANVSGFGQTMRISLNDNLLSRGSPAEIEAVMAHEIGHYALNHIYESLLFTVVVTVIGFLFVRGVFEWARVRWPRWGIRDITDPAGLPLIVVAFSIFTFVLTPVSNSFIRSNEAEADLFGLNAARQPDGFATVALKLGEYRKLAPGDLEEALMFDHPSGRSRILMAMTWKARQSDGGR